MMPRQHISLLSAMRSASTILESNLVSNVEFEISEFTGVNGPVWLLTIVRNCCYDCFRRNGILYQDAAFDEETHVATTNACDPETVLLEKESAERTTEGGSHTIAPNYREVLVLREFEELSYKDISGIVGVPMGTVMSRLSRARHQLRQNLAGRTATA
jgi:RNA polymerase sigma factor (sigma-70 family)